MLSLQCLLLLSAAKVYSQVSQHVVDLTIEVFILESSIKTKAFGPSPSPGLECEQRDSHATFYNLSHDVLILGCFFFPGRVS
jgi:hypothetical protein